VHGHCRHQLGVTQGQRASGAGSSHKSLGVTLCSTSAHRMSDQQPMHNDYSACQLLSEWITWLAKQISDSSDSGVSAELVFLAPFSSIGQSRIFYSVVQQPSQFHHQCRHCARADIAQQGTCNAITTPLLRVPCQAGERSPMCRGLPAPPPALRSVPRSPPPLQARQDKVT